MGHWGTGMSQPASRTSHLCWLVGLLGCAALAACKPREIPVACTPLPIVDGYETAMTEGGKMRLRVPAHSVELTENCKEIKSVELVYFWHKGELVWRDDNQFNPEISKQSLSHPIKIYLRFFQLLHEAQHSFQNDTSLFAFKPWRVEGALRHSKYPLEFYPKYFWAGPDKKPATAPPDAMWGVVGTREPLIAKAYPTLCGIVRGASEPQTSLVNGDFPKDYSDAKCRGGITAIKGDKVASGMIDVWANNAHDIDKIYNAVISQIQTYIQE
jgi:hypothetical protein